MRTVWCCATYWKRRSQPRMRAANMTKSHSLPSTNSPKWVITHHRAPRFSPTCVPEKLTSVAPISSPSLTSQFKTRSPSPKPTASSSWRSIQSVTLTRKERRKRENQKGSALTSTSCRSRSASCRGSAKPSITEPGLCYRLSFRHWNKS